VKSGVNVNDMRDESSSGALVKWGRLMRKEAGKWSFLSASVPCQSLFDQSSSSRPGKGRPVFVVPPVIVCAGWPLKRRNSNPERYVNRNRNTKSVSCGPSTTYRSAYHVLKMGSNTPAKRSCRRRINYFGARRNDSTRILFFLPSLRVELSELGGIRRSRRHQ